MQVLNLDFCTLTKLPPSLGQLTALTTLDVEGNLFLGDTFKEEGSQPVGPSFPPQLSRLQSLRYLNLNSCGLMQVPLVSFCVCYRPCLCHSSWKTALRSPVSGHSLLSRIRSVSSRGHSLFPRGPTLLRRDGCHQREVLH